jgi:hypothetical protein
MLPGSQSPFSKCVTQVAQPKRDYQFCSPRLQMHGFYFQLAKEPFTRAPRGRQNPEETGIYADLIVHAGVVLLREAKSLQKCVTQAAEPEKKAQVRLTSSSMHGSYSGGARSSCRLARGIPVRASCNRIASKSAKIIRVLSRPLPQRSAAAS